MKTNQLSKAKEKIITECTAWSVEHMNEMMDKLIAQAKEEGREEGIKLGKESGINSTYPCVNLDDETLNCELCGHDHTLASKNCRCSCCLTKKVKIKVKIYESGLLPLHVAKAKVKLINKAIEHLGKEAFMKLLKKYGLLTQSKEKK